MTPIRNKRERRRRGNKLQRGGVLCRAEAPPGNTTIKQREGAIDEALDVESVRWVRQEVSRPVESGRG